MNPFRWLVQKREEAEWASAQHRVRMRRAKLHEHLFDPFDNLINPQDEFEGWLYLDDESITSPDAHRGLVNLGIARGVTRRLTTQNPWAKNFNKNLRNYVVGTGFTYEFRVPEDAVGDLEPESFEELVPALERVWNEFVKDTMWSELERDIVSCSHRDGDHFLRFFELSDGTVAVRVVDPSEVKSDDPDRPEGMIVDPNDPQTVTGYEINGEPVPASEIEHVKVGTDRNVLRGWPTLWDVREHLVRGAKILKNIGKVTEIQAALAMVREHPGAMDTAEAGSFLDGQTDKTKTDFVSGKTIRQQRILSGAIIDVNPGGKIHFPVASAALQQFVGALQAVLRTIAAAINFPEHMLTADASNNNYASILMAAAPSTKEFEAWQAFFGKRFVRVVERVRDAAIANGRLPQEARFLQITATGPQVESKDELKTQQGRQIQRDNGVLSERTWAALDGLDYEKEQKNREEHIERQMSITGLPLPPKEPGDEDDEDNADDANQNNDQPQGAQQGAT